MNLALNATGGTLNLVGTWFGPVSLFAPIKQVSQIISGMILFSYILRTEPKPDKDVRIVPLVFLILAFLSFISNEVTQYHHMSIHSYCHSIINH